jgi:hypothetical protein
MGLERLRELEASPASTRELCREYHPRHRAVDPDGYEVATFMRGPDMELYVALRTAAPALLNIAALVEHIAAPLNQRSIADGYENIVAAWQQQARDALVALEALDL